jgi:hypothetical protein
MHSIASLLRSHHSIGERNETQSKEEKPQVEEIRKREKEESGSSEAVRIRSIACSHPLRSLHSVARESDTVFSGREQASRRDRKGEGVAKPNAIKSKACFEAAIRSEG